MANYLEFTKEERYNLYKELCEKYEEYKALGLKLDMSRGKPAALQIDISNKMLDVLSSTEDCIVNGIDCRNYGVLDGIPAVKELFAPIVGAPAENLVIGGNSSLTLMYDLIAKGMTHGLKDSPVPWSQVEGRKFLCPAPGYDRHFAITETFGFELITIPMTPTGPDMDMVEELVSKDPNIKGIWCVPKYSNPDGITYSAETVKRFASLKPAAPDFAIMWDNAYVIHDLYDEKDELLNLMEEAEKCGTQDMVYSFVSTSKVTFPGSGVSVVASSKANIDYIKKLLFFQTISYDKLNQVRHLAFFKNTQGILEHMKKHADMLRPKFRMVIDKLESQLGGTGCGNWIDPKGGYFLSYNAYKGCAKRIVSLCAEAGIVLTGAGATFPYGKDPQDSNIRLAPSFPTTEELSQAMDIFCLCAKIATLEKLLNN